MGGDGMQARPLNMAEVLALLRAHSLPVLRDYLEHLVLEVQVTDPSMHTELVLQLCDAALQLMPSIDARQVGTRQCWSCVTQSSCVHCCRAPAAAVQSSDLLLHAWAHLGLRPALLCCSSPSIILYC